MECGLAIDCSYNEFNLQVLKQAALQRIPVKGSLELTFRCNLHCQHCYLANGQPGMQGIPELSTLEIQNIIAQFVDAGCLWFLLTGGEPLLRKDFKQIYLFAKRKGLLVHIFTNGTLITPDLADLLSDWRPFCVEISLYGSTQETYERITGVPGSHARCMRGLELLLQRKIPLRLKTVLMTVNQHELGPMQDFARSLGVNFYYDTIVNKGLNGGSHPLEVRLPPERIIQIDLEDPDRRTAWQKIFSRPLLSSASKLYSCDAGRNSFHIDPFGNLSLCMLDRRQTYRLRQGAFIEGWQSFLSAANQVERTVDNACGQCRIRTICTQCPGQGWIETGDPQQRVEYICELAHQRAAAFL
jgi:radical SAM protein with 4Fe4S-binding SPASM domain